MCLVFLFDGTTVKSTVQKLFCDCLYNLGDREPEKPKRPMCTSWLL